MREGSSQTKRHHRVERGIYERITQGGRVYEFCYQDSNGHTRWETTRTLALARKRRAIKIAAVDRGEQGILRSRLTFAEFAEVWFEAKSRRLRRRTADAYRAALDLVLLPRFGSVRLSNIDADAIVSLIRDLEREGLHAIDPKRPEHPLGRSSVENYLLPLAGTLTLAVRRRLIASNPFDVLTADDRPRRAERKSPHEWTDDELTALLDASRRLASKAASRYDYAPLLRVAAALGLRLGEVLGLRWYDFDAAEGLLYVRRQWTRHGSYGETKTHAGTRAIPLPEDLLGELISLRLRSRFSKDTDPVFASREGTPLAHRNVTRRGFEAARDLAGLRSSLRFHDLRHACASRLIDAGLDPVTVAAVLGHEDPNVTLRVYAARFNRQRKDDAVRLALAAARPVQRSRLSPRVDSGGPEGRKVASLRGSSTDGD